MKMAFCRIVASVGVLVCLADARAPSEKLNPRQQLLQLLQQAPNTASPATLAEVAGALGSLALEADHSKDDGATIEAIRKMITELTTAIEQQHTAAQTAIQSQGNFQTCVDAKTEAFGQAAQMASTTTTTTPPTTTSTTTTVGPTTTTMHADLKACKAQEAELLVHNKTCHSELQATHSAKTATCQLYNEINYPSAGAARVSRCADSTLFSGTYEDFLERDIQMLATLRQREQNCTDTSAVYSSKSTECESLTTALSDKMKECLALEVMLSANVVFDTYQGYDYSSSAPTDNYTHYFDPVTQTNCGPYVAKVAACSNYDACYGSEVSMMDSAFTSAKQLATSRQAEMTALKRILCLLDVLQLPAAEQPTKLTECIATSHDVSTLTLVKPATPAKAACDPGATPAGCVAI